jgi:NADH oxidase (H2O2-forming)
LEEEARLRDFQSPMQNIFRKGMRIVIIGNGIAGNSAASAIKSYGRDVNLTILSEEEDPLYSPCAFQKYLAGEMREKDLFLKTIEDYFKDGAEILFGQKVLEIDAPKKLVKTVKRTIPFDKLILATGGKTLIPSIPGREKNGVFSLKTLAQARSIFKYQAQKVAVLGSGPTGIDAAIALRKRGMEVFLTSRRHILPRRFDEGPAFILQKILEDHGIRVFTQEVVEEIEGRQSVRSVSTQKRRMACDMAIFGTGLRPNIDLGKMIGCEIGRLNGIQTNDRMETDIQGVYACGDCIESRNMISGESALNLLWPNAKRQGWVAGCNCAGESKKFAGSMDVSIMEIFGTYAVAAGKTGTELEKERQPFRVMESRSGREFRRLIISEEKIVGLQLINRNEQAGMLISKMVKGDKLPKLPLTPHPTLAAKVPWKYWLDRVL